MNKSITILLTLFLAISTSAEIHKTEQSEFENELFELCKSHYLFDDIKFDTNGQNGSSIWLSSKVWNNPKDTWKLVDSMMQLLDASDINIYEIFVFGKPSLINRIALIKVISTGASVDYSYVDAKRKFAKSKKPTWKTVDALQVRGRKIFFGLHADSVFKVLSKSDAISESDVKRDETGGLIVTHHWKVDNQLIDITLRRWDNMYRVHTIRVSKAIPSQKEDKKKYSKEIATRPKSCHIYEDCTLYGGCKTYSNCYGACLDDCKRVGCSLCK